MVKKPDAEQATAPLPPGLGAAELWTAGRIPDSDAGVKAIVDLANKASEINLVQIPTTGLGAGLPETIPATVDHRPDGRIDDLTEVIEAYRLKPRRREGVARATTLASFIDMVNRHKTDDSAIFAATAMPSPHLLAVIDYHGLDGEADWMKHRVRYDFPLTDELKAWLTQNAKPMEQTSFAQFLEDHAAELATPFPAEATEFESLFKERFATPNELISLSRSLEVHVGQTVKNAARLSSGERAIEFTEVHNNAKGEKIEIPGLFMVSVPAFIAAAGRAPAAPVRIPARLRYRISEGKIVWLYQLYRADAFLRDLVQIDLLKAKEQTGLPAWEGAPEA